MWGVGSTLGPDTTLCHLILLGYPVDKEMCALKLLGRAAHLELRGVGDGEEGRVRRQHH